MKLNLGCGFDKREGWRNVDKIAACEPDDLVDLETIPWPWPDSSADEILMRHLLEHVGETSAVFLAFMKELWRVSEPSALIRVVVPHPRSDEFLWDATHVRPITPEGLRMFSQARNRDVIQRGNPETPLGLYTGIDFDLGDVSYVWRKPWAQRLDEGGVTQAQLQDMLARHLNVAKEISITLRAVKPARHDLANGHGFSPVARAGL
jgi:hypothetical protein